MGLVLDAVVVVVVGVVAAVVVAVAAAAAAAAVVVVVVVVVVVAGCQGGSGEHLVVEALAPLSCETPPWRLLRSDQRPRGPPGSEFVLWVRCLGMTQFCC